MATIACQFIIKALDGTEWNNLVAYMNAVQPYLMTQHPGWSRTDTPNKRQMVITYPDAWPVPPPGDWPELPPVVPL